jgi:predicted DNA-binding transcriptional regulator AlpA
MQDGDFGHQNRVLTSWKEIAAYLGKGVRTVQRWEKDFGLPVRRPTGSNKSAILARTRDLDAWIAMRCSTRSLPHDPASRKQQILSIRTSLAAGLATSQMLRELNLELLLQVKNALNALRSEIVRMQSGTQSPPATPPPALPADSLLPLPQDLPAADAA